MDSKGIPEENRNEIREEISEETHRGIPGGTLNINPKEIPRESPE